jgi:type III restriction enzyme
LARFNPSLILELTATPQTEHRPERDKHASNILYSVSAAELKAEQMIKMPIRLTTDADWVKTIGGALDCQKALEEAAKAE